MMSEALQQSIDRVCARDSLYWAFRHGRTRAFGVQQEVEIRIDLPSGRLDDATEWYGWTLAKLDKDLEAVFLRRRQTVRDDDLRRLFVDALTLAHANGGRFHSWVHGDEVRPVLETAA